MSITTLGDRCVNVVGVCGVELVRLETARSGNDDTGCAARVAVAGFWMVFADSDDG
ncbi:MAG: hypothetical protein WA354_18585 [Terracidiphilus sp.]